MERDELLKQLGYSDEYLNYLKKTGEYQTIETPVFSTEIPIFQTQDSNKLDFNLDDSILSSNIPIPSEMR